ncbi:MAG: sulfatase-like hydrolase/transferase [Phycisphaerae bacterium]|nr:sulfatase-like hydrolase/transferase [Phycisphaerae bacterium]
MPNILLIMSDDHAKQAIQWLKNRDADKPFCLLLHPKPPHEPYHPAPPRYRDFLKDREIPEPATLLDDYAGRTPKAIQYRMTSNRLVLAPHLGRDLTKAQRATLSREELTRKIYQDYIKDYYRLVKSVDDNVARVLDYLKESGLEETTLVIYTSDQGFFLGEHGFYNKQWMYEPPLHQPLIIRYPGMDELYQWELFDIENDPGEMKNLYRAPEHRELCQQLKKELRALAERYEDPVQIPLN